MKKINKMKKIAILLSVGFAATLSSAAFAAETEVVEEIASVSVEEANVVPLKNMQLRSLLEKQKDAQELLNNSGISIDATLGDIAKYGALTAAQEAKNKLEASVKDPAMVPADNQQGYVQNQGQPQGQFQQANVNDQSQQNIDNKKKKEEVVDIRATAVYTLGNVGYAEITYNGSKTVVRQGGKLPNGAVVESLTPLSVVINDGKEKKTLPIVAEVGNSAPTNEDFTMSAPRMN